MDEKQPELTADHIIDAVLDGFKEGEAAFGVMVRRSAGWFGQALFKFATGLVDLLLIGFQESSLT